jgi:hypothetical protein
MSTRKTLLGFNFNGEDKTLWLKEGKRNQILTILHSWLCTTARGHHGISFKEFESAVAWLRHAFTALPTGLSLLSPCNAILRKQLKLEYMQRNKALREAIEMCCTLLSKSTLSPTQCGELVHGGRITWASAMHLCLELVGLLLAKTGSATQ